MRHAARDDDVNLEPDQLLHQPGKVRLALGRSHFEHEILSLSIAELGQAIAKRRAGRPPGSAVWSHGRD